jgi:phospholipase/lecithinase/hemolysin
VWLLLAAGAFGQPAFTGVYVLGDSLSDVGNAAAVKDFVLGQSFVPEHTVGLCNPADVFLLERDCEDLIYEKSRVSNGPVAAERLATLLGATLAPSFHVVPGAPGAGTNYAVAGAKARGDGAGDLATQVDALLVSHRFVLPKDPLYVLMIGGNDVIDALQSAFDPANLAAADAGNAIVRSAVEGTIENLRRLLESGARYALVANVPNVGALPMIARAAQLGATPEAAASKGAELSLLFNTQLAALLEDLAVAHPGAQIRSFDLHGFLEARILEAKTSGENAVDGCFDS